MSCSFQFKQFCVKQDAAAMKVGTDGVVLGAWVSLRGDESSALDIGTGTGLIALMLAQRSASLSILGIDIDPAAAEEAAANFAASPWSDRLVVRPVSLQTFLDGQVQPGHYESALTGSVRGDRASDSSGLQVGDPTGGTGKPCRESPALPESPREPFAAGTFDLIVSNPPFFKASLKAPDAQRRTARHDDTLPPTELIAAARRLLSSEGHLAVIYPPEEARDFVAEAEASGLYLSRLTRVISVAGQPPKRHLMEFTRKAGMPVFDDLVLHEISGGPRSAAYRALTADFYLD